MNKSRRAREKEIQKLPLEGNPGIGEASGLIDQSRRLSQELFGALWGAALGTYPIYSSKGRAVLARSPGCETKEVSQGHCHGDWLQYKACAGLGLTAPS